jgi:hypothetical protein
MKVKVILVSALCASINSPAFAATPAENREFGHWLAQKVSDDFNPNIVSCDVQSLGWIPATENNGEQYVDGAIRLHVDSKAITSSGGYNEGLIASFYEWDYAYEQWKSGSDVFDDGLTNREQTQNVATQVDGVIVDIFDTSFIESLKGENFLTYRYTAYDMPNSPVKTYTVSLIGFTQAWNYAVSLCS